MSDREDDIREELNDSLDNVFEYAFELYDKDIDTIDIENCPQLNSLKRQFINLIKQKLNENN